MVEETKQSDQTVFTEEIAWLYKRNAILLKSPKLSKEERDESEYLLGVLLAGDRNLNEAAFDLMSRYLIEEEENTPFPDELREMETNHDNTPNSFTPTEFVWRKAMRQVTDITEGQFKRVAQIENSLDARITTKKQELLLEDLMHRVSGLMSKRRNLFEELGLEELQSNVSLFEQLYRGLFASVYDHSRDNYMKNLLSRYQTPPQPKAFQEEIGSPDGVLQAQEDDRNHNK